MKQNIFRTILPVLLFCIASSSFAQVKDSMILANSTQSKNKKASLRKNFIKTNLFSIPLKNYSLQYERALTRKISVALSCTAMPYGGIPFKSAVLNLISSDDGNDKTSNTIDNLGMGMIAITPEVRLYLSKKGWGRGFYIAPYYRYTKITSNDFSIFYDDDGGGLSSIKFSGSLTSNSGGILFGVQHTYGRVALDYWVLGAHIGNTKGNFSGTSDTPLSDNEQSDIHDQLTDTGIPLITTNAEVTANSASWHISGLWGGIRMGVQLGINF